MQGFHKLLNLRGDFYCNRVDITDFQLKYTKFNEDLTLRIYTILGSNRGFFSKLQEVRVKRNPCN